MPKFEIKALKVAEFASEETLCFQAKIYMDGKPAVLVSNEGHGGPDMHYPIKFDDETSKERFRAAMAELEKLGESKFWTYTHDDGESEQIPMGVDGVVGEMVDAVRTTNIVKRELRKKILFTKPDAEGIWAASFPNKVDREMHLRLWAEKFPERTILNRLPIEKAVELYLQEVGE